MLRNHAEMRRFSAISFSEFFSHSYLQKLGAGLIISLLILNLNSN